MLSRWSRYIFVVIAGLMTSPVVATAAEGAEHDSTGGTGFALAIGAAIAIGVAAFGGALGQGKAVTSALEGISRNPEAAGKMFTPMLLGLVFIESLVLYAFVIAWFLQGKI